MTEEQLNHFAYDLMPQGLSFEQIKSILQEAAEKEAKAFTNWVYENYIHDDDNVWFHDGDISFSHPLTTDELYNQFQSSNR